MKFALAFYVTWFLAVIVFQFSDLFRSRLNPLHFYLCGLLPIWQLFTPRPSDGDWLVFYRTSGEEAGPFSGWQEAVYLKKRHPGQALFNANAHLTKAMQIVCQFCSKAKTNRNVYYRLLLNEVCRRAEQMGTQDGATRWIQFHICWRTAEGQETIFYSHVHAF